MALTPAQFLQSLLNNITGYYTAVSSTDTDLHKLLRMYSNELYSGSIAIDTVRTNAFIPSCESSLLYPNYGSFFDLLKSKDQSDFEDRYISTTVPNVLAATSPNFFVETSRVNNVTSRTSWFKGTSWPFISTIDTNSSIPNTNIQESVLWNGDLYGSCAIKDPNIVEPNIKVFVKYRRGNHWIPYPEGDVTVPSPIGDYNNWISDTYINDSSGDYKPLIPSALNTVSINLGRNNYSDPYLFFIKADPDLVKLLYPTYTGVPLNIYLCPPNFGENTRDVSVVRIMNTQHASGTPRWGYDPGILTYTNSVQFDDNVYFGVSATSYPFSPEDASYQHLTVDTNNNYPFLFKFDPAAGTCTETGLAALISSGSYGVSGDTPESVWNVNALTVHNNRVLLSYSSGSADFPAGQRRNYIASYDGISYSGSTLQGTHTAALNAPSGSVLDLISYNSDLFAITKEILPEITGTYTYRIAKAVPGLETLPTTIGHWKLNQNLLDSSSSSQKPLSSWGASLTYTVGFVETGLTAIHSPPSVDQVVYLPAVDATDFDMGTNDFTVEVICKILNIKPGHTFHHSICHKGFVIPFLDKGYQLSLWDSKLWGSIRTSTSQYYGVNSSTSLDNSWHYIVLSVEYGVTLSLYIDGLLVDSTSLAGMTGSLGDSINHLQFLDNVGGVNAEIFLDEVRISTESLSAATIFERNRLIQSKDYSWQTCYTTFEKLQKFNIHLNKLFTSSNTGNIIYYDSVTGAWTSMNPINPSPSTHGGYNSFVSSGSTLYASANLDPHWEYSDILFKDLKYYQNYSGSNVYIDSIQPASIPGYRKHLEFEFNAGTAGSTIKGVIDSIKGFTLITPEVQEASACSTWKLKVKTDAVTQAATNNWTFSGSVRQSIWDGAHVTFYSGSNLSTRIIGHYLVNSVDSYNVVNTLPIYNTSLLFGFKRGTAIFS